MTSQKKSEASSLGNSPCISDKSAFAVSSKSTWLDLIWFLDTKTPGRKERIGWDFLLADGTRSTDSNYAELLEGFRVVFWGMLHDGLWYGKPLTVGSSGPFGVGMRELFIWMVWRGFRSFSSLKPNDLESYLDDLPALILDRQAFYNDLNADPLPIAEYHDSTFTEREVLDESFEEHESSEFTASPESATFESLGPEPAPGANEHDQEDEEEAEEDDQFSYHQAYIRLNTLYYIFAQSPALEREGLGVMSTVPFGGQRVGVQVSLVAKHVKKITPPLPDEVAQPLLQSALCWIDTYSADVLELQSQYFALRNSLRAKNYAVPTIKAKLVSLLESFRFSCPPESDRPWHSALYVRASHDLRGLILRTRDACVLALEYFVGMRISEICSAKYGTETDDGFPHCIEVKRSKSGLIEMFFIDGLLSKGRRTPVPQQWLIGCRVVGSAELPPAVRAVVLLDALFRPWRNANFDALVGAFTNPHSLPWESSAENALSGTLLKGKKVFLKNWVDLSHLPDRNERGENLAMYRDSAGVCIRSQHGRKTFAAYILESRTSLLTAVSRHFKHLNAAITEASYFSTVTRLRQETEASRSAATVAFFVGMLQGRRVYGQMAALVYEYFNTEEWSAIKGKIELFKKVEGLVAVHGLKIYFADHGNCMIMFNPLESRCRNADTRASWLNDTPQYAARSPSMCAGCGCNLMDSSHLPFWRGREAALVDEGADKFGEFRVHLVRRDQAKKVVRLLESSNGRQ